MSREDIKRDFLDDITRRRLFKRDCFMSAGEHSYLETILSLDGPASECSELLFTFCSFVYKLAR